MHDRLAVFIDGAWSTGDGKRSGAGLNPATGEEIGRVPFASFDDIDRALAAARHFRTLRAKGVTVRKTIDTLIETRCIMDGLALLYSDRDFDPFVEHLGLASAMDQNAGT